MLDTSSTAVLATDGAKRIADEVCALIEVPRISCEIEQFRDGEMVGRVLESVMGLHVILFHTCTPPATNSIFELFLLADACRRGGAIRITAVTPYLAYTRGDKRNGKIESIAAKMIADFLDTVGITELICIEPHFSQFEGFCAMRALSLSAIPLLCSEITRNLVNDAVIVAPDAGALRSARIYGQLLNLPVVLLDKRTGDVADIPVAARSAKLFLLIDDMISTGKSLSTVIRKLRSLGLSADVWVSAAHGLFLDSAVERLFDDGVTRIFVTDTLIQKKQTCDSFKVVGVAGLIAHALRSGI